MENKKSLGGNSSSIFAFALIVFAVIIAHLLFYFVMGNDSHFNEKHEPLPGDYLGIMYKGGFIVPFLMSFFLIVLGVSIERGITLIKAFGSGSLSGFVSSVKSKLANNDIDGAIDLSSKQQGSVANVTFEVLNRYKAVASDNSLTKDKKIEAVQKEVEEATLLELPALEKNLTIISTLASVSTLFALLGTVIGMIKAFAALSASGSPDPSALATGISEALVNTALGIFTSAIAIVAYNFFTSKVDDLTQNIDEIGFAIRQTFLSNVK